MIWFKESLWELYYIMESLVKQETQPKPRLIVRLGIFLASHHILFRFILISPSYCSLNASFSPFLFPISLFTIFGSVLFAALRVLLRSSSSLHLPKIHTSRRMLLYRVSYPLIYFLSTAILWMHICYCYHWYLFFMLFLVLLVGFIYRLPQLAWN